MKNNWQQYRTYFPVRYFESGFFDTHILNYLKQRPSEMILDIGGGAYGTEVLQHAKGKVYLLDPYISTPPTWMAGKVDLSHELKFDLIVCRGAINYLTLEEMANVTKWLKPQGVFMANTFLTPPPTEWTSREAINGQGVKGIERYRLEGQVVKHELVFPDYEIQHEFFYHSLEEYSKVFSSLSYAKHGTNSVIIQVFG